MNNNYCYTLRHAFFNDRAYGNDREDRRVYVAAYPNWKAIPHKIFGRIYNRLENVVFSLNIRDHGGNRTVRKSATEERGWKRAEHISETSIRRIVVMERISPQCIWRDQLLYPYHIQAI